MLFSLALILLFGIALSGIFNRFKIPGLLAMIITGIVLGPYILNLISPSILNISRDLRQIALIVILTRAGLSLDIKDLKKVGRPAILMCFIPATFELLAIVILAPIFLHISVIEASILGTVLAAVSPAIVVPRMIRLIESGYGKEKSIPQIVMAGASVDDVFVIVLFTAFMGMYQGKSFDAFSLILIPLSIILGLLLGIITGIILSIIFKRLHLRDTIKVMIILSMSFLFITIESFLKPYIPVSGLLSVMALGGTIFKNNPILAKRLLGKFSKIWVVAEIFLFVLVGAAVNINSLIDVGLMSVLLILCALIFRVVGVNISLIKTNLNQKEKLFTSIAYLPKATVQAAIGSLPLASGVKSGDAILSLAVLAIMITAPLGAFCIDYSYKKLLSRNIN